MKEQFINLRTSVLKLWYIKRNNLCSRHMAKHTTCPSGASNTVKHSNLWVILVNPSKTTSSGNTVSGQGLSQVKKRAGLVIMSLFYLVNLTTKILVAEQSYTHLATKESQILCKISLKTRIQHQ